MWRYHCLELYFLVPFIVVYRHFLHLSYHHHHHHHHLHHLHHYYYFLKIFQPKSCKELLDLIEELQPLVIEDGVALVGSRTSFIITAAISYSLSLSLSVCLFCVCVFLCVCVCVQLDGWFYEGNIFFTHLQLYFYSFASIFSSGDLIPSTI